MAGNQGWDFDPRAGMLANQGRPAGEPITFLKPPKPPMPRGMKVTLWLGGLWVFGVVIVVLARKFVRNLSCMYDTTEECRRHAASSSTNVTLLGFVLLVVVSVITIVIFELRRDK